MRKSILLAALVLLPFAAFAQQADATKTTPLPTVSITANGVDVKTVLHNVFTQAKKSYVIQPNTYFSLNLVLDNIDFDEALQIICKTANLSFEIQNGIYYVSKGAAKPKQAAQQIIQTPEKPKLQKLPESIYSKKLTTRLNRADIADVFAAFGKQTGTTIEVDKSVPAYKLDAFLINTSLRYALERVTKAAGLEFELTDHATIRIYKPVPIDPNHVAIIKP